MGYHYCGTCRNWMEDSEIDHACNTPKPESREPQAAADSFEVNYSEIKALKIALDNYANIVVKAPDSDEMIRANYEIRKASSGLLKSLVSDQHSQGVARMQELKADYNEAIGLSQLRISALERERDELKNALVTIQTISWTALREEQAMRMDKMITIEQKSSEALKRIGGGK